MYQGTFLCTMVHFTVHSTVHFLMGMLSLSIAFETIDLSAFMCGMIIYKIHDQVLFTGLALFYIIGYKESILEELDLKYKG